MCSTLTKAKSLKEQNWNLMGYPKRTTNKYYFEPLIAFGGFGLDLWCFNISYSLAWDSRSWDWLYLVSSLDDCLYCTFTLSWSIIIWLYILYAPFLSTILFFWASISLSHDMSFGPMGQYRGALWRHARWAQHLISEHEGPSFPEGCRWEGTSGVGRARLGRPPQQWSGMSEG